MSFGLGLPFREPAKPKGHPLLGYIGETPIEDVRDMLARRPPTAEECDALAAEEIAAFHRQSVLDLLSTYLPYRKPTEWKED